MAAAGRRSPERRAAAGAELRRQIAGLPALRRWGLPWDPRAAARALPSRSGASAQRRFGGAGASSARARPPPRAPRGRPGAGRAAVPPEPAPAVKSNSIGGALAPPHHCLAAIMLTRLPCPCGTGQPPGVCGVIGTCAPGVLLPATASAARECPKPVLCEGLKSARDCEQISKLLEKRLTNANSDALPGPPTPVARQSAAVGEHTVNGDRTAWPGEIRR